jgi:two-component system response regulator AtoC
MATILIVDDEAAVRFALEEALTTAGHAVIACATAADARTRAADADAVVTDIVMPDVDGFALLAELRRDEPDVPVILLSARGSERIAAQAIKAGAWDYLPKPFAVDELRLVVARAVEARALRRAARAADLTRALGTELVGDAPAWRKTVDQARRLAGRDVALLVTGETGSGKELIASLVHAESKRRDRPLVRFNCAAIAPELADAELFGHVRGAFTGATADRPGFFAQADGGTLVLDEVGELPAGIQAKLLRALQDGEIQPVGAGAIRKVDVRVVACTHRDLAEDSRTGRFRADLYYRLAVVTLHVPPLRERAGDIPALVEAFRRRYAIRFELPDIRFTSELVASLAARDWPGNVRELENAVAGLVANSDGGLVDVDAPAPAAATAELPPLRARVDAFERSLLAEMLRETGGNQSEAARRLGVTRSTLIDKLKRFGLS